MKKLLILVDNIGPKKEFFAEYIQKKIDHLNAQVVLARFADLVFDVNGISVSVTIDGLDLNLRDVDLVYLRRAGRGFVSLAGTIGIILENFEIPFFDKTWKDIGPSGDKFTSLIKLSLVGVPTIPTYFCWHSKIAEKEDVIIEKFGLPLIAKQLSAQRGDGVYLIKEKGDFQKLYKDYPTGEFLFQKYLKNDEEYRVLVLGDTIGAYEEKVRTDPEEFRSNVALGAIEEFLPIASIPPAIKEIAIKAAKALEVQVAGVDVLVDNEGNNWLIEVNRGPGLTYDTKVSPELDNLASFFATELKKTK